jgi:hypothetical protein
MSSIEKELETLRNNEYNHQQKVNRLRRDIYHTTNHAVSDTLLDELEAEESKLEAILNQLSILHNKTKECGLILKAKSTSKLYTDGIRGKESTGIDVKIYLRMAQIPTSFYHLLNPQTSPLISCEIHADEENESYRRLRVSSFIEGFSAKAVNTCELAADEKHTINQLPTLFQKPVQQLTELTRATLNIKIEDLDGNIEQHQTYPIWMLARTTAPLSVKDPKTGLFIDLKQYLAAFVTPNAPDIMNFLRTAADYHPNKSLVGYQESKENVFIQIKAIFDALKKEAGITYVNSVICFNPNHEMMSQRIRLPRESLTDKEANCIDGTVLYASLLEAISMNPAIVMVPGHAFIGWETWENSNDWEFLETTMTGTHTFEEACASGKKTAKRYNKTNKLKFFSIKSLRANKGITPME